MTQIRQELVQGKTHLIRDWKNTKNLYRATSFAFAWNIISWSFFLMPKNVWSIDGNQHGNFWQAVAHEPLILCVLLFPAIGLPMIYHAMALWINHTRMTIDNGSFEIRRGPLYWSQNQVKIPVEDIKQAYVQEYSVYTETKAPEIRFQLVVQRYSCGDMVLESDICTYNDAKMLEKWLEDSLGIVDQPVPGEVEKVA
jgi:hypothetical protein